MLLELYRACPDLFYLVVSKVSFDDYISVSSTCTQLQELLVTSPQRNIWHWYEGKRNDEIHYRKAFEDYVEICQDILYKLMKSINRTLPHAVAFWMERRVNYSVYPFMYKYAIKTSTPTISGIIARDLKSTLLN